MTMITRRSLLKAGLAGGAALIASPWASADADTSPFLSRRPPLADRKFSSPAVEAFIQSVQSRMADQELAWMFGNCFPNTLDTVVHFHDAVGKGSAPDTFVLTGDIKAMWLRDTTAELWPYLPLMKHDPRLQRLFQGAINRQSACIRLDPYANAFLEDPNEISQWAHDDTVMKPGVHEHKWEIDSLCFPIRLAYRYWKVTGDTTPFDAGWEQAMDLVVQTFREQQRKDGHGPYYFQRGGPKLDLSLDSSYGAPVKPVGLIFSAFRPSDDHTTYPFLIPSNFFAVIALQQMAEMLQHVRGSSKKALAANALADEVKLALKQNAVQKNANGDEIYAYEIDGLGHTLFMDDANVPSLLSLPYIGACSTKDPVYIATRRFIASAADPSFVVGKYQGLGSPHTGHNSIWPIGLCLWGLTSTDSREVTAMLANLKATHAGTGFMHESFNKDDPSRYTRSWFAWANSLFGEFVVQTLDRYPHVLASALPSV
jgi:meiotically up-regulated gene 157 (Mug157) protein